jgi:hypothetical protein
MLFLFFYFFGWEPWTKVRLSRDAKTRGGRVLHIPVITGGWKTSYYKCTPNYINTTSISQPPDPHANQAEWYYCEWDTQVPMYWPMWTFPYNDSEGEAVNVADSFGLDGYYVLFSNAQSNPIGVWYMQQVWVDLWKSGLWSHLDHLCRARKCTCGIKETNEGDWVASKGTPGVLIDTAETRHYGIC